MRRWRSRAIAVCCAIATLSMAVSVGAEDTDATQGETERLYTLALDHWIDRQTRLHAIAQRISVAGRELCGSAVAPVFGAVVLDLEALHPDLLPTARERFGRKHRFYVTAAFSGMAAQAAGLHPGDAVVEINGRELDHPSMFYANPRAWEAHSTLSVVRGGRDLRLEVENIEGCGFPAEIKVDDEYNAYATGEAIRFMTAYLRHTDDDLLLAQTVGHEIAHNVLRHPRTRQRSLWGSRRNESQADYLGLYLVAMAGYPLLPGGFEEQMLGNGIAAFSARTTHPTSPQRELAFRKTVEEIERARAAGEPLQPNFE
ncbi:MAG: hypothetical protein GY944_17865 [bacterium]|nr:hypothetical protein [bacterium]